MNDKQIAMVLGGLVRVVLHVLGFGFVLWGLGEAIFAERVDAAFHMALGLSLIWFTEKDKRP